MLGVNVKKQTHGDSVQDISAWTRRPFVLLYGASPWCTQTFQMFAAVKFQTPNNVDGMNVHPHTGAITFIFLPLNTIFEILHYCWFSLDGFNNVEQNFNKVLLPSRWRLRSCPGGSDGRLIVSSWCWYIHQGLQGQSTTYVRSALWLTLQCT